MKDAQGGHTPSNVRDGDPNGQAPGREGGLLSCNSMLNSAYSFGAELCSLTKKCSPTLLMANFLAGEGIIRGMGITWKVIFVSRIVYKSTGMYVEPKRLEGNTQDL